MGHLATTLDGPPAVSSHLSTLNLMDLEAGTLSVERLGRGFAWLDAGIFDSLLDASNFFRTIEQRQGLKVARVEEVAWRMGYIDSERFLRLAEAMPDGDYRRYVRGLIEPTGNS